MPHPGPRSRGQLKSPAKIPDAWALRNCLQVRSPRCVAGPGPAIFKIAGTAAGAVTEPGRRSSGQKDHDHERQRCERKKSEDRELDQAAPLPHSAGSADGACEVQGRRAAVLQLRRLLGGEYGGGDAMLAASL